MNLRLQLRDFEILRTLLRLRFVTTREILSTFFTSASSGRHRLSVLSEVGFIMPHTKGLLDPWGFRAWRLTPEGIEMTAHLFPDDPIPDGLAERLAGMSLFNIQHRCDLNRVYFRLIQPEVDPAQLVVGGGQQSAKGAPAPLAAGSPRRTARPEQATTPPSSEKPTRPPRDARGRFEQPTPDEEREAREEAIRAMRARASAFLWMPDGDRVYRFDYRGEGHQLVPDAVVLPLAGDSIIFLELDRSTKALKRVRENLERYAVFFRDLVPRLHPGKRPRLVYVVPSNARAAGVGGEGKAVFRGSGAFRALPPKEAIPALRAELGLDAASESPGEAAVSAASPAAPPARAFPIELAQDLYRTLCREVGQRGDVPEEVVRLLHRAHGELRK